MAGIWTGISNSVWNDESNWAWYLKPDAGENVTIPAGTPYNPCVYSTDQECNNITIDAGAALRIYDETLTVNGDLLIYGQLVMDHASGVLNAGNHFSDIISWESGSDAIVTKGTINVSGDWYFKNGTDAILGGLNTVVFIGSNFNTLYCDDNDAGFGCLTINKPASPKDVVDVPANHAVRVAEDFYIADGIFEISDGVHFGVGNELYVDNGCELSILGTAGNRCTVSGYPNYCLLEVAGGGIIGAEYTTFEYLEGLGLTINAGATVDPLHPLNYCTFQESPAGGSLLTIANDQDITIDGAIFPSNTWGGQYNATKLNDQGSVTFTNVQGYFVGDDFDNDPYSRIAWPGVVRGVWTGAVNHYWNYSGNWAYHLKPFASSDVTIPSGTTNDPWISTADQECNNITIEAGATLRIYDEMLFVNGDMIIHGELRMDHASGVLYAGNGYGDVISWEPGSTDDITDGNIYVKGDWYFKDGTNAQLDPPNTVTFFGGSISKIYCDDTDAEFGNLTILKQSPPKDRVDIPLLNTVRVSGDIQVGDGVLKLDPDASLYAGNGIYVGYKGTFAAIGNLSKEAVVSGYPGYCQFDVAGGGTISAQYAIFEYLGASGLLINSGAIVDPVYSLNYCTFREGSPGGNLLTIDNDQNITVDGAIFPLNTWGSNYNVAKNLDQGTVTFTNVQGGYVGEDYERDPHSRIEWPGVMAGIWTGATSSIWDNTANWKYYLKPDGGDDVYIPALVPNFPWVSSTDQECNNITIESGAQLRIYDEILTVHGDMIINGLIRMDHASGVLNAGDSYGDLVSWEAGSKDGITSGTINVFGDWNFKNGTNAQLGTGNTVNFIGTNNSFIYCDDPDAAFGDLYINKSNSPKDIVDVPDNQTLRVAGDITVYDGVLEINSNSSCYGGNKIYVDSHGTFSSIGTSGSEALVSGYPGYYQFEVAGSGTIRAEYSIFEYMNNQGIFVNSGATVDPLYPFNHCTFREGETGGTLLMVNNSQLLTIDGANFPPNTWGSTYNVTKNVDQGRLTFTNVQGGFVGEDYERDPYSRIEWSGVVAGIWTGITSFIWDETSNWKYYLKPDGTDDVIIPAGTPYDPWVSFADQECNNITIEAGAKLRIYDETLTVHGDMIIFGELRMDNNSGVLNAGDSFGDMISWETGSTDYIISGTINVFGDWNFKNGTNARLGSGNTVIFYGDNESVLYCDDSDAEFGNLTIDKTSIPKDIVEVPAANIVRVAEDLLVREGIFELNPGVSLYAGNEIYINNAGTLSAIGISGNEILVSGDPSECLFDVANGGTISSEYTLFEYIDSQGIYVNSGATIDPLHPFNNCTFRDGASGGTLLAINNSQHLTIDGAHFPSNTWSGTFNVAKTLNQGQVTFTNCTGSFAGEAFENDPHGLIDWPVVGYSLDLRVLLEGPFNGTSMDPDLNGVLPLSQPYNAVPWNYPGTESVVSIPLTDIVDWVLVELRDAPNAASATGATMIARQAGFLKSDGSIVGLDGTSLLQFTETIVNNLFVVIWQRNHLAVMSAYPLLGMGGVFNYDFTTDSDRVYGGILGHKEIGTGIWGMIGGDGDGDGQVTNVDKNDVWSVQAGFSGYLEGDFSMDSQVNNLDKNDIWAPNSGSGSQVLDNTFFNNIQVPEEGYRSQVPD